MRRRRLSGWGWTSGYRVCSGSRFFSFSSGSRFLVAGKLVRVVGVRLGCRGVFRWCSFFYFLFGFLGTCRWSRTSCVVIWRGSLWLLRICWRSFRLRRRVWVASRRLTCWRRFWSVLISSVRWLAIRCIFFLRSE